MCLVDRINHIVKGFKPNAIIQFSNKISSISNLILLTLGEPDFHTPDHIKRAAIKAIKDDQSHYTNPRGILPLRKAASNYFNKKYGMKYNLDTQIIATTGVTEAIYATFKTILNPGDTVIIPSPTFSFYAADVTLCGGKPVYINTAKTNYELDPKVLDQTIRAHRKTVKAVVLNYPNNPIGNTYDQKQLTKIANVIKKYKIFCVTDEIYSDLTYGKRHVSMGTILPKQTIVFNGVSKSHAMTGWRVGLIFGPADIVGKINKVHQFLVTSDTTNAQYAAAEAFAHGFNDGPRMRKVYQKRRDILRNGLQKVGFTSPEPQGAFYIFAKIPSQFTQDSFKFGLQLAKEAKVGTIPGAVFGPGGDGHLRISYAASTSDLKRAVKRIQNFVKQHPSK